MFKKIYLYPIMLALLFATQIAYADTGVLKRVITDSRIVLKVDGVVETYRLAAINTYDLGNLDKSSAVPNCTLPLIRNTKARYRSMIHILTEHPIGSDVEFTIVDVTPTGTKVIWSKDIALTVLNGGYGYITNPEHIPIDIRLPIEVIEDISRIAKSGMWAHTNCTDVSYK